MRARHEDHGHRDCSARSCRSIEETSERRSDDRRELPNGGRPRHGPRQKRLWNQARHQGLRRRTTESARCAEEHEERVNRQEASIGDVRDRETEERARGDDLDRITGHQNATPIESVRDLSGDERKRERRNELREAHVAEVDRAPGQRKDVPAHDHGQDLVPEDARDARAEVEGIVARRAGHLGRVLAPLDAFLRGTKPTTRSRAKAMQPTCVGEP